MSMRWSESFHRQTSQSNFASSWYLWITIRVREKRTPEMNLVTYYSIASQLILLHINYTDTNYRIVFPTISRYPEKLFGTFFVDTSGHLFQLLTTDSFLISLSIPRCTTQNESLLRIL